MNQKPPARMTFTRRMLLSLLLVSMVPVIVVGMISYNATRDTILNLSYDTNRRTVQGLTQQLDLRMSQVKSLINTVASNQEVIDVLNHSRQSEYEQLVNQSRLETLLASYSSLSGLVSIDLFDMDNNHYHAGDTLSQEATLPDVRDSLFTQAIDNGVSNIYWAGVEKNVNFNSSNPLVITTAKIITDLDQKSFEPKPIALLLVNFSLTDLYESFSQSELKNGSFAMVIDNQNQVIYHPETERLGATLSGDLVKRMTNEEGSFSQEVDGQLEIFTYTTSSISGWKTIVVTPVKALTAPADAIGAYTLIVIAIMLVVVFFVSNFTARAVVQPVLRITDRIKLYHKGDSGWKIPLPEIGNDEIGELTRWFNTFQANLKARHQAEDTLRRQGELQAGIAQAMTLIVAGEEGDDGFSQAIAVLGQSMHVDRAYFYEIGPGNEAVPMTLLVRYAWRREGANLPTVGDFLVNDSSTTSLMRWYSVLAQGNPIDGAAESFPVTDRTLLRQWGIQSILLIPILREGKLWGILGFDDCFTLRSWADFEKSLLKMAAMGFESAYMRRRAVEQLASRESQFRLISDNISDIIALNDFKGNFLYVSPSIQRVTGFAPEEIMGTSVDSRVSTDEMTLLREKIIKPAKEGRPAENVKVHLRTKDGRTIWLETHAEVVELDGEKVIQTSSRDVTQRHQAEEELAASLRQTKLMAASAEAANRSKNDLLASMSREIRTPMNAILGVTGKLSGTQLSADQMDYVKTILESGDALLGVVNNILDYSKIEAGKLELEEFDFDLRECLESSFDLIKSKASAKNLEAKYWMDSDVPQRVRGDMSRLRQVLVHLLDNAVKFTQQGGISVQVSRQPDLDDARVIGLHFAVVDTGIGMSQEQQDRIFKPFGISSASVSRKISGSGLGLTISQSIVTQMGGRMWVVSSGKTGGGAAFHFVVQMTAIQSAEEEGKPYAGRTAWIVDETDNGQGQLQSILTNWGVDCRIFPSITDAVLAVNGGKVDLVIVNYPARLLPGLWDVSPLKNKPDFSGIPFIACTLWGVILPAGVKEYFDGFLARPIQKKALMELLRREFKPPEAQPAVKKTVVAPRVDPLHAARILVVEDNTVNLQVTRQMLEALHYRVETVSSGVEAMQSAVDKPFDIILMDLQMPDMDGLETTRHIRASQGITRQPYILGMAAEINAETDPSSRDAGINAYIQKPLEPEALSRAVNAGLEQLKASQISTDSSKRQGETTQMLDRLAELVGKGNNAELGEVIRVYCGDMQKYTAAIMQAYEENDWAKVQQHAHTLKSASLLIGAEQMGEYCKQLETFARGIRTGDEPAPNLPGLLGKILWEQEYLVSILPGLEFNEE